MDDVQKALREIEAYCRKKGMKPSTFGRYAVKDDKFIERLRCARERTAARITAARAYMADNPPEAA